MKSHREETGREEKRTSRSPNRMLNFRYEQQQAPHYGNVGVQNGGLCGDLQGDGSEAPFEALDNLCRDMGMDIMRGLVMDKEYETGRRRSRHWTLWRRASES